MKLVHCGDLTAGPMLSYRNIPCFWGRHPGYMLLLLFWLYMLYSNLIFSNKKLSFFVGDSAHVVFGILGDMSARFNEQPVPVGIHPDF